MPWKLVCDFQFHEVLQTTIIRQITKENSFRYLPDDESNMFLLLLLLLFIYIYVCVCVCVCVFTNPSSTSWMCGMHQTILPSALSK